MEETILVGDDLMMGPPSPFVPPEIASYVLDDVDKCDGILRNLFLCKCYSNDMTFFFECIFFLVSIIHNLSLVSKRMQGSQLGHSQGFLAVNVRLQDIDYNMVYQACKSMTLSHSVKMSFHSIGGVLKSGLDVFSCSFSHLSYYGVYQYMVQQKSYLSVIEFQDMVIRQRLQDSEHKLGLSMPLDEAKERASQLMSEITLLERYFNIQACIFHWFVVVWLMSVHSSPFIGSND